MERNESAVRIRLRLVRKDLGKTQLEMAALLGVSWATVSRWECGLMPIGNEVLLDLALSQLVALRRTEDWKRLTACSVSLEPLQLES
jgi:transcriptional regulator with XRE-family HTH domain